MDARNNNFIEIHVTGVTYVAAIAIVGNLIICMEEDVTRPS